MNPGPDAAPKNSCNASRGPSTISVLNINPNRPNRPSQTKSPRTVVLEEIRLAGVAIEHGVAGMPGLALNGRAIGPAGECLGHMPRPQTVRRVAFVFQARRAASAFDAEDSCDASQQLRGQNRALRSP
jgi:hypothetical protein